MIFNIYYINFPKVYEIKMMLNYMLLAGHTVEKDKSIEGEAYLKTKLGFHILDIFKLGEAEAGGNIKGSGSKKVLEIVEKYENILSNFNVKRAVVSSIPPS
mgnify:CR=1 FL=1